MRAIAIAVSCALAAAFAGACGGGGGDGSDGAPSADSSSDQLEAARAACIDEINRLRATKGRPAYGRWRSGESCADGQASSDEGSGMPHGEFNSGNTCDAFGQNECLGQGVDGIVGCLDQMWAEKDQPGCSGCDACADAFDPSCPNCDFFGDQTGDTCGHYVNMSANYFTMAACGFSSLGGWDAINFK